MAQVVCSDCGKAFDEDRLVYGGRDFCPACRKPHSDAAVNARNESYVQYRRKGLTDSQADTKSMTVASGIIHQRSDAMKKKRGR